MTAPNNPLAFPCIPPQDIGASSAVGYPYPEAGMTLRDYFAIRMMPIAAQSLPTGVEFEARCAEWAYEFADAMLKARET